MFRAVFAIVFLIVSVGLIGGGLLAGFDTATGEVLGNLGTEVFGILVTIAVVDWFLEKRRRQDRARDLAWNVLHSIERAVWVWQGGPRQPGTDELLGLVAGIQADDVMESSTQGLIQKIGLQCRGAMQKELASLRSLPGLSDAFQDLAGLTTVTDNASSSRTRIVAEIMESSVMSLARLLDQPTQRIPSALMWYRDATPAGQVDRYYETGAGLMRPFDDGDGVEDVLDEITGFDSEPGLA